MHSRSLSLALPVLLLAGLPFAAACGGGNGASPETYEPQDAAAPAQAEAAGGPCALLTDDEVGAALGTDVLSKARNDMQLDTCEWTVASPEGSAQATMGMVESELQLVLMPEAEYRSRTDHPDLYHPLDGLGDEAVFAYAGGSGGVPGMAQLYVLDGDQGFLLIPGASFWNDRDAALSALKGLAEDVIARS
ncbi:MAG: hypothetical protein AB7O67_18070 [Vicinamibacterales bacterium]